MRDVISWPINFMQLDVVDWIVAIALCIPTIILFDKVRYKLGIVEPTRTEQHMSTFEEIEERFNTVFG